jgi:hypothetical protein
MPDEFKVFHIDSRLLDGKTEQLALEGLDQDATVAAIVSNSPFPPGKLPIGSIKLSASSGKTVAFLSERAKDSVTFSANASGFFEAGIYPDAADLLNDLSPERDIASGIELKAETGSRFLMLRCGYDVGLTAKGTMALGIGASANFGSSVSRKAAYGIIHEFQDTVGARDVLATAIKGWILPNQVGSAESLPARTWLVTEIDGSLALSIGAQAGYDYSWMRQFPSGALKGDLGLKVQLAANAALGFSANGTFALALSRETEATVLRLRLFKLDKNGWTFAFNATAGEQVTLPNAFQGDKDITDLISAVFGIHVAQLVNDLTDPNITNTSNVAKFIEARGAKEFQTLTGVSPEDIFAKGKAKVDEFVATWKALENKPATMLATILKKTRDVDAFTSFLQEINGLGGTSSEASVKSTLAKALGSADFFQTSIGQWVESVVPTTALAAITGGTDWKVIKTLSGKALDIINGKTLQSLINFSAQKLGLDNIQTVQNDADALNLDPWIQEKLANFLGADPNAKLSLAGVQKAQRAVKALMDNGEKFYALSKQAIQKKYEIAFTAGYQSSTTSTALIDATFDFGANSGLLSTLQNAINGDMGQLLLQATPGVTLNIATLTHGINRQSHSDLTMPFVNLSTQDVSAVLASVSPVEDNGRILVYSLNAKDEVKSHSGFFHASSASDSKFALVASVPVRPGLVIFNKPSVSCGYTLSKAANAMGIDQLFNDLAPLITEYMPELFGDGKPTLSTWVDDIAKSVGAANRGVLGQSLLTLDVGLPVDAFAGWFQAPADKADARYFAMSRAIQKHLRRIIPFFYFKDPSLYDRGPASDAILAYSALPVSNGFDPTGQKIGKANGEIYFDLDGSLDSLVALMNGTTFIETLGSRMTNTARLLRGIPHLQGAASEYDVSAPNLQRVVRQALERASVNDSGSLPAVLGSLLLFELNLIESIMSTGVQIAKFRADAASKPANAVTELSAFGDKLVQTFHNHLGGNLVAKSHLRPLGSALIAEAGLALAENSAASRRPTALLRLTVFDSTPPIAIDDLLAGTFDQHRVISRQTLASPIMGA